MAEAAGVSHGLVFQYFGSKKGLYIACLQPLIEFFRERIEPDPDLPPTERLRSGAAELRRPDQRAPGRVPLPDDPRDRLQ